MEKHIDIILRKMSEYVGVNFDEIDSTEKEWKEKYSWTTKQSEDFVNWLTTYMLKPEARKQLMLTGMDRENVKLKNRRRFAIEFLMFYGWKIKD